MDCALDPLHELLRIAGTSGVKVAAFNVLEFPRDRWEIGIRGIPSRKCFEAVTGDVSEVGRIAARDAMLAGRNFYALFMTLENLGGSFDFMSVVQRKCQMVEFSVSRKSLASAPSWRKIDSRGFKAQRDITAEGVERRRRVRSE